MNIVGIVPARAGSKGLVRKNVRVLGDKPLVQWAMDAALTARTLSALYVSSDDPDVLDLARARAGAIALERPADLAADDSPAIDYVRHVLAAYEASGQRADAVCIVQPTSPFTLGDDVDACVEVLEQTGADTVVTVVEMPHDVHPVKAKRLVGGRLEPYLEEERGRMSKADLPPAYVRNCSVYLTRREVVESGVIIGQDCRGVVMPRARSVDINDAFDFRFAQFLWAERNATETFQPAR